MSRDPIPRSRPFDLYHASACDDAPVSHGHRPNKGLRIIIADDHPVVLTGIEMVLSSFADFTCSVVARLKMPCALVIVLTIKLTPQARQAARAAIRQTRATSPARSRNRRGASLQACANVIGPLVRANAASIPWAYKA